ncbi:30S ribosomal protein S12 methylthiotransferase RimO [Bdellovibrionales bacterium]|nr:30S ribosomal protein S12 methylthiotransferase RimO [Bdellovibrionales bacterium]
MSRSESGEKKVHFVSLGCPKNLVDSEIMLGSLGREGYQVTERPEEAETIIVNTCGFIEEAKQESISAILELAEYKERGCLDKLVVAGCLTQRYKNKLVEGIPEADLFVGSGEFQNIGEILRQSKDRDGKREFFDSKTYLQEESTPRTNSQPRHRAYLKISEGCRKRCSFCAIPLIRGELQSRTVKNIVSEAKLLVAGGVKELTVISHDYTDYGWDLRRESPDRTESPYELLKALSDESGASWIRILYLYPDGIDKKMVELIRSRENLVNYFDMPLQHINDTVLKAMNRRMTRSEVETVIAEIRGAIPEAVIRTQFIVGFPGETEEQFQELLEFVETYRFDRVGCFIYSVEEETKAATMDGQVDAEVKQRRYDELMSLQKRISHERQKALIGQVIPVLVEGVSEESELLWQGRTSQQAYDIDGVVYINDGAAKTGDIVPVRITDSHDYDLVGHILSNEKANPSN